MPLFPVQTANKLLCLCVFFIAWPALVHGQGPTYDVVMLEGEQWGGEEDVFGAASGVINENGDVLVIDINGLWLWKKETGPVKVAFFGDPAPGVGEGRRYASIGSPVWGEGDVFYFTSPAFAKEENENVDIVDINWILWKSEGGGTPVAIDMAEDENAQSVGALQANDIGELCYITTKSGPIDALVFWDSSGIRSESEALTLKTGDSVPSRVGDEKIETFQVFLGQNGGLGLRAAISGTLVDETNDIVGYHLDDAGIWDLIYREGSALPDVPEVSVALNPGSSHTVFSSDDFLYNLGFQDTTVRNGFVWGGSSTDQELLFKDRISVPTDQGPQSFNGITPYAVSDALSVLFFSRPGNVRSLWLLQFSVTENVIKQIAAGGTEAPGIDGNTFITFLRPAIDANERFFFRGATSGDQGSITGVWAGTSRTDITSLGYHGGAIASNDSGAFTSTNIPQLVDFNNNQQALMIADTDRGNVLFRVNVDYIQNLEGPRVIWSGEAGDNNWHTIAVTETNWNDNEGNTVEPPGKGEEFQEVEINNNSVLLNEEAVSNISLQSTGGLEVSKPLDLRGDSSIAGLKLAADMSFDGSLKLPLGQWVLGDITGTGVLELPTSFAINGGSTDTFFADVQEMKVSGTLILNDSTISSRKIIPPELSVQIEEGSLGRLFGEGPNNGSIARVQLPVKVWKGGKVEAVTGSLVLENLTTINDGKLASQANAKLIFDMSGGNPFDQLSLLGNTSLEGEGIILIEGNPSSTEERIYIGPSATVTPNMANDGGFTLRDTDLVVDGELINEGFMNLERTHTHLSGGFGIKNKGTLTFGTDEEVEGEKLYLDSFILGNDGTLMIKTNVELRSSHMIINEGILDFRTGVLSKADDGSSPSVVMLEGSRIQQSFDGVSTIEVPVSFDGATNNNIFFKGDLTLTDFSVNAPTVFELGEKSVLNFSLVSNARIDSQLGFTGLGITNITGNGPEEGLSFATGAQLINNLSSGTGIGLKIHQGLLAADDQENAAIINHGFMELNGNDLTINLKIENLGRITQRGIVDLNTTNDNFPATIQNQPGSSYRLINAQLGKTPNKGKLILDGATLWLENDRAASTSSSILAEVIVSGEEPRFIIGNNTLTIKGDFNWSSDYEEQAFEGSGGLIFQENSVINNQESTLKLGSKHFDPEFIQSSLVGKFDIQNGKFFDSDLGLDKQGNEVGLDIILRGTNSFSGGRIRPASDGESPLIKIEDFSQLIFTGQQKSRLLGWSRLRKPGHLKS